MRLSILLLALFCTAGASAQDSVRPDLSDASFKKLTDKGVPERGLRKVFEFLQKDGAEFVQQTYTCKGRAPEYLRPCDDSERTATTKTVTIRPHRYAAVVDFARPSTEKRFFLIDLVDGKVESFLATHGRGSGVSTVAYRFSNTKDSKQTSLGMYLTGEIYEGGYGKTLRMYGLEKSNDQAYNRDIVLHGAYYASADFIDDINPQTGSAWNRLGVSWGCPAVALSIAKRIIPLLAGGALMYHDHAELADEALSGREVVGRIPLPDVVPLPPRRPVVE